MHGDEAVVRRCTTIYAAVGRVTPEPARSGGLVPETRGVLANADCLGYNLYVCGTRMRVSQALKCLTGGRSTGWHPSSSGRGRAVRKRARMSFVGSVTTPQLRLTISREERRWSTDKTNRGGLYVTEER
jgi:hypothetical protein